MRNLLNIFVSPMCATEYILSLLFLSVIKLLLTSAVMVTLAWLLYSFNIFTLGYSLVPLIINLVVMGWAVGIVTTALILRFGQEAEVLAWGVALFFQPVSAVFYPVAVLPWYLKVVADYVPASHVFEGMRAVVAGQAFPAHELAWAAGLNINDPEGLRDADLFETTRKALRATREEPITRHALRLVDADWHYCDFVIDRAFRWAVEQQRPVRGDYPGIRARLIRTPVTEVAPLIYAHLDTEALRQDTALLAESAEVLAEPEFRTWVFHRETLQPYLDAVQRIKDSPLVLNEMQQKERFHETTARAVEDLFGGERQASWVGRFTEIIEDRNSHNKDRCE